MSFDIIKYPLLAIVEQPENLRSFSTENLVPLCKEIRNYLLSSVSISSGHFASGLGVVELTVALHYVYNTPFDHIIWDVGHQAYPHKILTGRRDKIASIRKKDGLHPFPFREESEYDVLSVGHSSTSISAGIGLAIAAQREGNDRKTVCIIGDGAMTAGMAFEAMNHAGAINSDILVILNDNEMSISENVGALNNYLAQLLSGKLYSCFREGSKKMLSNLPPIKELVKRTEEHLKGMVVQGTLFEEMGFNYIGPIDGHDVLTLVSTLSNMRKLKGPQLLHIATKKGKGYAPAELDPISWHSVPKFDPVRGTLPPQTEKLTFSNIFGHWLCNTACQDRKLIAITPAMREGSGMLNFSRTYPQQFFDVAIAEQHAVTFASGLAIGGYHPVVAIYSTFLQRAYDQIIHDVALQKLPILFAIDRAGIVGSDGPTHQGAFDISFLRCIPNMIIMTPSDENECLRMLQTGYLYPHGPCAVRYPKGSGTAITIENFNPVPLEIGKGKICRRGAKIAILNFGTLLAEALRAAIKLDATVVDMRFVKPLDKCLISQLATEHSLLVTLEENVVMGGAGSAVNELIMSLNQLISVLNIGLPDIFIQQGTQKEIRHDLKLDHLGILEQITNWLSKKNKN